MEYRFTVNTVLDILNETFRALDSAYRRKPMTKLIFPTYSNGDALRISEQELRFAFIDKLTEREWPVYYSVETPTIKKYRFSPDNSGREVPRVQQPEDIAEGIRTLSAQFDTVIHSEDGKRMCLLEFKGALRDFEKDFLKLNTERGEDCPGFFVELLNSENKGTIPNKIERVTPVLGSVIYVCHVLETGSTYILMNDTSEIYLDDWKRF